MKKLVAYITTGYPELSFTKDLALSLSEAGVDMLELGIPFSDPVADGPIIEQANLLSLQNGYKSSDLFKVSKEISGAIDTLWMGYFNSFYHHGFENFSQSAKACGVSGFIIPDLPFEEAQPYLTTLDALDIALISFVAPTHTKERIAKIAKDAKKFIYLVAYAGITGSGVDESLDVIIPTIREYSDTPIYLGFGVNEKNAKEKSRDVDGVIVGSAFVKVLLDDALTHMQKITKISETAKHIKESINM
ncbi:MAG: tryptophan synthase subunit alpha [Campylobacterales bacterium]|nr:tryptophan synthase subunit alpha [Campylobacterales bacterium]